MPKHFLSMVKCFGAMSRRTTHMAALRCCSTCATHQAVLPSAPAKHSARACHRSGMLADAWQAWRTLAIE